VAAGEGDTAIIREARAAKPICRCHPRSVVLRALAIMREIEPGGEGSGEGTDEARRSW
jgi:hypothetical protein